MRGRRHLELLGDGPIAQALGVPLDDLLHRGLVFHNGSNVTLSGGSDAGQPLKKVFVLFWPTAIDRRCSWFHTRLRV